MGTLSRLVIDADAFAEGQFGRSPHLRRGADLLGVLDLDDVDRALTTAGLRRPAVRVVRNGHIVDPSTWTRRARTGAVVVDDLIEPARVLDRFASGDTIVLQSLQRWWAPVGTLCRGLEADLGHVVQANAYLTPSGATGLTPHHDTHDVFVVQLHGSKRWTLREPVVESPLRRHRSDPAVAGASPVCDEIELTPGDVLYLPRGIVHSAAAQDGTSLHLTLGVLATTAHDVVMQLVARVADRAALRRSLPIRWAGDPERTGAVVAEVIAELRDALDEIDPWSVAEALQQRHVRARSTSLAGHLVELDRLDEVDDATVVRPRPGPAARLEARGDRVALIAGRRTIDFPAAVRPALERLLAGPVRVGSLDDLLEPSSRSVLARRLIRDTVLVTGPGPT